MSKIKGSAICLGANILSVFKQLGIYDEFITQALPLLKGVGKHHPPYKEMVDDYSFMKKRYGEYLYILDRPKLHMILKRLVPESKIHLGKRVMSMEQSDERVAVRCNDGTTYRGDVLIGADGAYSAVRQRMYQQLRGRGLLPPKDDMDPPFDTYCLLGTSRPLPPGTYKAPSDESRAESVFVLGPEEKSAWVACYTARDGAVNWMVGQDAGSTKMRSEDRFRHSEWGPEVVLSMAEMVRDIPSPFGPPMSTFIDNTPKEDISKVIFEYLSLKKVHGMDCENEKC
ncbi:hypothetical protein DFQ26_004415 [Actinomortierella ambigua]|nr:hypothetical protein DFQ26_004415 [Actinomortierella ambigua]